MINAANDGGIKAEGSLIQSTIPGNRRSLPKWVAIITAIIGLTGLAGWMFSIPMLKSVLPGAVEMKANTAIGLLLSAWALFILGNRSPPPNWRLAQSLALAVTAIGFATLGEYLFGWRLGIDELLFRDTADAYNAIHGRMSPYSAVAFAMIGLGLAFLPWRSLRPLVWLLSLLVLAIGMVSVLGYLWNAAELVTDLWLPPVAINTAILFALLGLGMINASWESEQRRLIETSVEIKIFASFVGAFVLLMIVGGYAYQEGSAYVRSTQAVDRAEQVRAALGQLYSAVIDAESLQRGYILSHKPTFLSDYKRLVAGLDGAERNLSRLADGDPSQMKNLAELKRLIGHRIDTLGAHLALYRSQGQAAAEAAISRDDGIQTMQAIHSLIGGMDDMERTILAKHEAALTHSRELTLVGLLAALAVAVGILSTMFLGIRREIISRSLAQRELQSSEENLSVTLNSIGDAVMSTDVEGKITRMNAVAEQLTGWSRAESLGRPVEDIFHIINYQTRQPAHIPVATTLAEGIVHGLANDTVLIGRDGRERPIADSCAPIRDRNGGVIGAVLVFRDVSEEYESRAALRDGATRIQTILNTVADGIITVDESGIVETINPAIERLFWYSADEITGKSISMLMPEPYRSEYEGNIAKYRADGETRASRAVREVTGLRKDGSTFPMYLAVSEMKLNGELYFTGIVHDITYRKDAEDQINRFFMLSLDMLCISSSDGYFKRINPAFTKVLGWSTEEILTRPFLDFVHPDDHAATLREVERQISAGESVLHFENRYLHKDGTWRTLSWKSVPYAGGFMFATARDVTEQNRMEEQLVAAKEQAERANRAKDSFLATMSHEIRTPLTGMLGMLELLSMSALGDDQRSTLKAAWESGRNLLRIVSDILDWSKIEAGKLEISPRSTSIPQLLQEVVNTYSRMASTKSLVIRHHADSRLSPVHIVDALRLSQVLNNFVSNAVKFTQRGEILLCAELIDQLESGERICFSVKDTGKGIAKDVQQGLFRRYQQESADTARMYGGTGLGLAICKRLAELMDGQIELESEVGKGSTFNIILTLPISGAPEEPLQSQNLTLEQRKIEPLHEGGMEAPLVLVVDDHSINRKLLAHQINLLGLRTETAENGEAALSLWRHGHFALVITDCHMPEMDGYAFVQAVRRIEAEEKRSRTPIIAWTANALAEEATACRKAGMDELLIKPTDLRKLRETVAQWLPSAESDSGHENPNLREATHGHAAVPLDQAVLNEIMPNRAAQLQILEDFKSHMLADRIKLSEFLDKDDMINVERAAHRMKGSCRMVGAMELADACAAIEEDARKANTSEIREGMRDLDNAIKRVAAYYAALADSTEDDQLGQTS